LVAVGAYIKSVPTMREGLLRQCLSGISAHPKDVNIKYKLKLFALLFVAMVCFPLGVFAWRTVEYCDVYVGPQKVFTVTNTPVMSAVDRAQNISSHIQAILSDPKLNPTHLSIRHSVDGVPVIQLDNVAICAVSAEDSAASGKSAQTLAEDWMQTLKTKLTEAKEKAPTTATAAVHDSKTLNEHAVLLLFLEIGILLLASLCFGELMVRLGQPAIIGQILAGLVLGQTFFGNFFPDVSVQLFPQDSSQSKLIEAVSWIGVSFLLMLTGMETDTSMLKRLGKPLLYLAFIGLLVPLIIGAGLSFLLPERLRGDPAGGLAFAVFVGTVFAVSSVPVVAKILMDMKLLKRDVGQLVLSASLSHDLLCCLLLAVIAVLAGSGGSSGNSPLLTAIFGTIAFVAVVYFGRPVFFAILRWVNDKVSTSDGLITAMIVMLLLGAATTQALGIHIVLGAFAVGVILSQAPVINHKVVRPLEIVTMGFFAPIFFASSGLNVNLGTLLEPQLAGITLFLCAASMASKLVGCYIAGKLTNLGAWESLAVGVGANAKGSMGLILAMLGYSLHIITLDMLAIVIFVSLFSTAVAPPLMKWTLTKVQITQEETERLAKEERRGRTILSSIRRVLWPTSGKSRNRFIGKLLDSIGRRQVIETVVLWVKTSASTLSTDKPFTSIAEAIDTKHVGLVKRTVKSNDPSEAIIEEANLGYDLLVMATDKPTAGAEHVFGKLVDNVILNTSTRVLVVYDPDQTNDREIKKVVVPVSGSELSVSAGEFGISLAHSLGAKITLLNIAESELVDLYSEETRSGEKIQRNITNEIEGSLKELAQALNVDFTAILLQAATHPAQAIIMAAQQHNADLIVLGAEPKMGKGLFLGHTINFVLRNAPCAVAILKLQA
jgi:Kef-type K+ transport system membrane component KefB/nucleotide-binding universal stress UspA family protein